MYRLIIAVVGILVTGMGLPEPGASERLIGRGLPAYSSYSAAIDTLLLDDNVYHTPVVTPNPQSLTVGSSIPVANLFSAVDPLGSPIAQYKFYDPAGGGSINLNGAVNLLDITQQNQGYYCINAADLQKVRYVSGSTPGTENLTIWAAGIDLSWGICSVAVTTQQVNFMGSWAVTGHETASLTVNGSTQTEQNQGSDTFVLGSDHSFRNIQDYVLTGTWTQTPTVVSIDVKQAYKDMIANDLAAQGMYGYLTISSYSFQGAITSGVLNLTMHVTGTVTVTSPGYASGTLVYDASFSGTRLSASANRIATSDNSTRNAGIGSVVKSIFSKMPEHP